MRSLLPLPPQSDGEPYLVVGRHGDFATLRCLRRLGCPWGEGRGAGGALCRAICIGSRGRGCRLEVLQWMVAEGCPVDWRAATERAAQRRDPEVRSWFEEQLQQHLQLERLQLRQQQQQQLQQQSRQKLLPQQQRQELLHGQGSQLGQEQGGHEMEEEGEEARGGNGTEEWKPDPEGTGRREEQVFHEYSWRRWWWWQ